jgi:hypothetical protein
MTYTIGFCFFDEPVNMLELWYPCCPCLLWVEESSYVLFTCHCFRGPRFRLTSIQDYSSVIRLLQSAQALSWPMPCAER